MIGKDFTGYKEVATIAADLVKFGYDTQSVTPVFDFITTKQITDFVEKRKVCRVARAIGFDVYVRQGQWCEKGIVIE